MKLYHSLTSPFVRNVLAVIDHHVLTSAVEVVSINPFEERPALQARNPLGKIPALELDDGSILFDSSVIVDYLDQLGNGSGLFEHQDISPHHIRTLYALSNGVLDAALASVMEMRRPKTEQSAMWMERWQENILSGVSAMADELPRLTEHRLMPHLSFGVTLDYLMFRLPHIDWQAKYPRLAGWAAQELETDFHKKTDPRLAA